MFYNGIDEIKEVKLSELDNKIQISIEENINIGIKKFQ